MTKLPEPLVPPDLDVRGCEPPWETFIALAVAQYGVGEEDARAFVEELKAQHHRERGQLQ